MSHQPQQRTQEKLANSSCQDTGHDWKRTAASNYRLCQRDNCKAAERLVHGQWVNARRERPWIDPLTSYQKRQAMPKQTLTVWDACAQQQGGQ